LIPEYAGEDPYVPGKILHHPNGIGDWPPGKCYGWDNTRDLDFDMAIINADSFGEYNLPNRIV
jgi:hypothetical protein